jgi:hypothetical protein
MSILQDILNSSNSDAKSNIAAISDALLATTDIKILSKIPILSTLSSAIDIVSTIRNRFLIQKIRLFLNELNTYDEDCRYKFFSTFHNIAGNEENLGEYVLAFLDSILDKKKAIYFGRTFNSLVLNLISYHEFELFSAAIDNIRLAYFDYLTLPPVELRIKSTQVKESLFDNFLLARVIDLIDPNHSEFSGYLYKISQTGVKFANLILNIKTEYKEYSDIQEYFNEIGYTKAQKERWDAIDRQSNKK